MKSLLFILCLCSFGQFCFAQKDSRVVFFRMDADIESHSSSLAESRLYTDAIFRNGMEIAKIRSCSVFIYNATEVKGTYFLMPFVNKNEAGQGKVTINPGPNSITIVKLSLSDSRTITSTAEIISITDFQKYFDKTKWLRKKLESAGYFSVRELIEGFVPGNTQPASEYTTSAISAYSLKDGQTDTLFYDGDNLKSSRDSARYYSVISRGTDQYYSVQKYFIDDNKIKMTGHYSNVDSETKEGPFVYYYKSGFKDVKGDFNGNKETGKWESYFDSSEKPYSILNYKEGEQDGGQIYYYKNGKVKRVEFHKIHDTTVTGRCYDNKGNEIPYFKFEIMPKPDYDYNAYLGDNIKYSKSARKHNVSGRVVVKFVVDSDGSIKDVKVIKHVSPELDEEAARVISQMPKWSPGLQDGIPVKVYFTLPIRFKLE